MSCQGFSERLRQAMNQRGMSTEELARRSGVGARSIARYRNGQVVPVDGQGEPTANARMIAEALEVEAWELICGREMAS